MIDATGADPVLLHGSDFPDQCYRNGSTAPLLYGYPGTDGDRWVFTTKRKGFINMQRNMKLCLKISPLWNNMIKSENKPQIVAQACLEDLDGTWWFFSLKNLWIWLMIVFDFAAFAHIIPEVHLRKSILIPADKHSFDRWSCLQNFSLYIWGSYVWLYGERKGVKVYPARQLLFTTNFQLFFPLNHNTPSLPHPTNKVWQSLNS